MPCALFTPIELRGLRLSNRVIVAPMCQYIAQDGCMHDWHLMHLGQFAVSGAGLVMTEMTDVEPEGRIGPYCVGLYSDACETAMRRVVEFCRRYGTARLGLQLAHAGRKSSLLPPWQGRKPVRPEEGGWQPVAPSPIGLVEGQALPRALSAAEIHGLVDKFVDAVRRADRLGFDLIELHGAHGYLIHQFLSPISNQRGDAYGGTRENRMRFPLEVFAAMRAAWPADKPMGIKLSVRDWSADGWCLEDSIAFCTRLKTLGCDYIVASSGGIVWSEAIPTAPGFQVPFASAIREAVNVPVVAVGLITEAQHAESIIAHGKADMVALARGMLYDPRWAWHAADVLGVDLDYPSPYARARPQLANDTFAEREAARRD